MVYGSGAMPGCKEILNGKNGLIVEVEGSESLIKTMNQVSVQGTVTFNIIKP